MQALERLLLKLNFGTAAGKELSQQYQLLLELASEDILCMHSMPSDGGELMYSLFISLIHF